MSQSPKRPGARDISELKARLGLKKSAPAAGAKNAGGVASTGSWTPGGVIPAPPGAQPPRPHIPDAKEDPFGAMNAMAAHGAVGAQQIVVVDDGMPVERVEQRSRGLKLALLGGALLLPIIFGVVIGKLSAGAQAYNRTIDDAASVRDDVKRVSQGLIAIQQTLQAARERSRGGQSFVPNDTKLTTELAALKPLAPDLETVFRSHLYELDYALVAAILSFYVEVLKLNEQMKDHVVASRDAEKIIKEGQAKLGRFLESGYAALLEVPDDDDKSDRPVAVKLVQLGSPLCEGDKKPSDRGCGARTVTGFRFRPDELGAWRIKKVAEPSSGSVAGDALVFVDPSSKVLQALIKGGTPTLTEASYLKRVEEINEKTAKLLEDQKAIVSHLNAQANKNKKFAFFL